MRMKANPGYHGDRTHTLVSKHKLEAIITVLAPLLPENFVIGRSNQSPPHGDNSNS
jgi:hypothetical protein